MASPLDALAALPPWDAAVYFQRVVQGSVVAQGMGWSQLIGADPNRIALIVSITGAVSASLGIEPGAATNAGLPLNGGSLPYVFLFSDTGPLCQQAWFVANTGLTPVCYIAVSLRAWPRAKSPPKRTANAANPQPSQRDRNRR